MAPSPRRLWRTRSPKTIAGAPTHYQCFSCFLEQMVEHELRKRMVVGSIPPQGAFFASGRFAGAATRTHDDARLLPGCVAAFKPLVCVLRSSLSLVCWCFGCLRVVSALAVAADFLAGACSAGAAAEAAGCSSGGGSGQRRLPQQNAATASATEGSISSTASCGIRAHDLPLTERVLCQLS